MRDIIDTIRCLTNKPILKSILLEDRQRWNLMCGSLDAIETTYWAVNAYEKFDKNNLRDFRDDFLLVYGLIQALYVQQDAVFLLHESVVNNRKPERKELRKQYPCLQSIRDMRNKAIGHPSKDNSGSTHSILIENAHVRLFSFTKTGEFTYSSYRISDCVNQQGESVKKILHQVIEKMRSLEKEHKERNMNTKFRDFFPDDPCYCIGKIYEAVDIVRTKVPEEAELKETSIRDKMSLASRNLSTLIKAVQKFQSEFNIRGLQGSDAYQGIPFEIKDSLYPLEKLNSFFDTTDSSLTAQDANAYVDSAKKHLEELLESAKTLDNEYSK